VIINGASLSVCRWVAEMVPLRTHLNIRLATRAPQITIAIHYSIVSPSVVDSFMRRNVFVTADIDGRSDGDSSQHSCINCRSCFGRSAVSYIWFVRSAVIAHLLSYACRPSPLRLRQQATRLATVLTARRSQTTTRQTKTRHSL
jgi:hypothetical protein